jgi:acetyltransferase-like isoleucine patch superfamily enzyme
MGWINRMVGATLRWTYGMVYLPVRIEADRRVFGLWHAAQLAGRVPPQYAVQVLRQLGATVGERATVKPGLRIENATGSLANLHLGSNCHVGSDVMFDLTGPIDVGNDVAIGAKAVIITHLSAGKRPLAVLYEDQVRGVVVENGAMIGTAAIILCGVHIGTCSWVSAGSVVNTDVPEWVVVAGNPARPVRKLATPTSPSKEAPTSTPAAGRQ